MFRNSKFPRSRRGGGTLGEKERERAREREKRGDYKGRYPSRGVQGIYRNLCFVYIPSPNAGTSGKRGKSTLKIQGEEMCGSNKLKRMCSYSQPKQDGVTYTDCMIEKDAESRALLCC